MDAPIIVDSKTAAGSETAHDTGISALAMETVEFELALQLQARPGKPFEAILADALANVGGTLLFDMPLQPEPDCAHVAAVSIPSVEGRILALVVQSASDGSLRVEPAEQSSNPVARIVPAYAGVMEHFTA